MSAVRLEPDTEISLGVTAQDSIGDFLRHRHGRAIISRVTAASPDLEKLDATWIVRTGLTDDGAAVSLESKNYPGHFLRHQHGAVYHHENDGSRQFAEDATFVVHSGRNGHGISLASVNFPDHYVRHWHGEVYIARGGGTEPWERIAWWTDDVSWRPRPAWAA